MINDTLLASAPRRLATVPIDILLADVATIAKRCISARFAVRAAPPAGSTVSHDVVGTRARPGITTYGLVNQNLSDLIVGLGRLRLRREREQQASRHHEKHFHDIPSMTLRFVMMRLFLTQVIGDYA